MTDQSPETNGNDDDPKVVIIGPDGMSVTGQTGSEGEDGERHITDLVEQPAKVMRIGSMIRQLLEEVKAAPLDEASRQRLQGDPRVLDQGARAGARARAASRSWSGSRSRSANETPSEAELRIAQAQLVGWLEGLFHGIQTAIYAQQVAARAQLEQMRRALPPGMIPEEAVQAAQQAAERAAETQAGRPDEHQGRGGGMYL